MPIIDFSPWGVRAVLYAFLKLCELYAKHQARCQHYLSSDLCDLMGTACSLEEAVRIALAALPRPGTWG